MRTDEVLLLLNDWWKTGKVKKELVPAYKRDIFYLLQKEIDTRQITVLTGLRRVGKSTVFYQLIEDLLEKGIEPLNILYFSFDEKVDELKSILDEFQKITGKEWKRERIYVFLDEIHKLKNWSSQLKIIYDAFPNLKFFVSGSSSVDLEKEAYSNLVGRHFLFNLQPLSLKEFFELKKGERVKFEIWKDEIFLTFPDYLKKPFPEIVNEKDERKIMEYLRENVVGKIIYRDLPKKFKRINVDLLPNLVEIFYQNPGMILNLSNLAKDLKISKQTLLEHLFYLRFSYLIRIVKNFRISLRVESRKLQKVYPYHWSLIFGFFKEIEKGKLLECIASSLLNAKFYWKKGEREIDFILKQDEKIIPVEVKTKPEIKNVEKFLEKFNLSKGIVLHEGKEKEVIRVNEKEIDFFPIYELAFNPTVIIQT